MEEKKISYRTKRLLLTIPRRGQHSFKTILRHYNAVYPASTRLQKVVNWVARKAAVRYRLALLLKAGYVDRRLKPVLNEGGPTDRSRYVYFITPSGVQYLNDR